MKLNAKWSWFIGFSAVFAALAGFVFWGTWSLDFSPVMPDSPIVYSAEHLANWCRECWQSGRFIPSDIHRFLGSPYFWQELNYAIPMYVSGLALAYFLRGRGLSYLACYGAGTLLGFCGYWCTLFSAGHGGWFFWMTYGIWPFGLLDRAIRKGKVKNWLLLGATVGWAAYWQTDLWLLFTVLTGSYFIYRCVAERKFPWKGMLIAAVSMFLIGGAAFRSALVNDLAGRDKQIEEGQTISEKDKATVDEREKRWIFVTNWSLPPAETTEFFIPRINGDTSCPMTLSLGARYGTGVTQYTGALGRPKDASAGNYRQHSLYVGMVTCLLTLCGIVFFFCVSLKSGEDAASLLKGVVKKDLAFFAIAAVVCWLFSMGRYCEPVYRVVFSLPFGDYLRAPVKWHHLTEFAICVMAGYGIEALLSFVSRVPSLKSFALPLVGVIVLIGALDLARIDRLYCAPVDLREARRQNANFQMTFLRRSDFNNPQVAAMVQAKRIVALAQPNPEMYLVGVLNPWGPHKDKPWTPMGFPTWLGIVSVLSSLVVAGVSIGMVAGKGNRQI